MYTIIEFNPEVPTTTLKEAKLAAIQAAEDSGLVMAVVKVVGYTKANPSFVAIKKGKKKEKEVSTDIPLNARCDFDGKIAVGSKLSATGDTVYLCIDCLGGAS